MDYQSVASPTNYGAPNVFQQQPQGQQQNGQQSQVAAALQKAKQLLSSGQISADQYNQFAQQAGELSEMGGNMGAGMPGPAGAGAPMNILPG